MREPWKHSETPVFPVYHRLCHLVRGQPVPAATAQYQEVNQDHPAVLNPDQLDNVPLDEMD